MVGRILPVAAAIGLALLQSATSPARAQTPSPPAKPAQPPAAPATPGAPAGTGQRFGNWLLACPAQSASPCVLIQEVSEALSRKVVFVWLMQYDADGHLLAAFRLPTGVFVDRGLIMKMDGAGDGFKVNYTRCDPGECQAVFTVSEKLLAQLSAAKTVSVDIALTNGKTANVQMDMGSFPAALNALAARGKGGPANN